MGNPSNQFAEIAVQNMFVSSSTQNAKLGQRAALNDGRVFRYARAGAVDLVAGNVIQGPATVAGALTLAMQTTSGGTSPGSTSISVTCASAVSTGFYNDGFLMVASGSGAGGMYKIEWFKAMGATGSELGASISTGAIGEFRLYFEDAIPALTNMTLGVSTSKISLIPNPYMNVVAAPITTLTGPIVGAATYVIKATEYGWLQTWGPCAMLHNDTTALGNVLVGVAATIGRVEGAVGGTTGATILGNLMKSPIIGYNMAVGVQGEWRPVFLTIAP